MHPTCPNSSSLPILLLLLFLFHSGLQAPTTPQPSNSETFNCSSLVTELESLLDINISSEIDAETQLHLWNTPLLRPNLCALLKAAKTLNNNTTMEKIKKDLENLQKCLPEEATPISMADAIPITDADFNDFGKKAQLFVRFLSENRGSTLSFRIPRETSTCAWAFQRELVER